jgi:hypothetical protein
MKTLPEGLWAGHLFPDAAILVIREWRTLGQLFANGRPFARYVEGVQAAAAAELVSPKRASLHP